MGGGVVAMFFVVVACAALHSHDVSRGTSIGYVSTQGGSTQGGGGDGESPGAPLPQLTNGGERSSVR